MKPYLAVKRILDFIFALVLLIIVFPVIVIVSIAIKIEDPKGPIFFKQKRIGKGLKEFEIFKFRSMKVEIVKLGRRLSDAERMMKVGNFLRKTSIDEIPQLFNILRLEMSFIGPRPLPIIYLPYYTEEELHRHDINPGISGWAQVNGRNYLSWDERFKYDLEYVSDISFAFDLRILLLTIKKVISASDIGVRGVDFEDKSLHQIREKNKNYKF